MNDSLLKRTIVVTLALLGASTVLVGTIGFVAVTIVERAVGAHDDGAASVRAPATVPVPADPARAKVISGGKPTG